MVQAGDRWLGVTMANKASVCREMTVDQCLSFLRRIEGGSTGFDPPATGVKKQRVSSGSSAVSTTPSAADA